MTEFWSHRKDRVRRKQSPFVANAGIAVVASGHVAALGPPMSEKNPIRVFVTHASRAIPTITASSSTWRATPNFFYRNCSVPDHPPKRPAARKRSKEEYRTQLKTAEVVVVLSSMYVENEYWTTYQMDAAQAINLPLVASAVRRRGASAGGDH